MKPQQIERNPTFPDARTRKDLPVDSYLRLTAADIAKVYQHYEAQCHTSGHGKEGLMGELWNISCNMEEQYGKSFPRLINLWDYCTSDHHYWRECEKEIPLPQYGDYKYFVIVHRCFDMAPVAREIAKIVTDVDDWQVVENGYHAAVYSPSKRQLFDIMADSQGEAAHQFPAASKMDNLDAEDAA